MDNEDDELYASLQYAAGVLAVVCVGLFVTLVVVPLVVSVKMEQRSRKMQQQMEDIILQSRQLYLEKV